MDHTIWLMDMDIKKFLCMDMVVYGFTYFCRGIWMGMNFTNLLHVSLMVAQPPAVARSERNHRWSTCLGRGQASWELPRPELRIHDVITPPLQMHIHLSVMRWLL